MSMDRGKKSLRIALNPLPVFTVSPNNWNRALRPLKTPAVTAVNGKKARMSAREIGRAQPQCLIGHWLETYQVRSGVLHED